MSDKSLAIPEWEQLNIPAVDYAEPSNANIEHDHEEDNPNAS